MSARDLRFPGLRHHHGVPGPVQEPHPAGQGAHPERRPSWCRGCAANSAAAPATSPTTSSCWAATRCRWPTVGQDFGPTAQHFAELGIRLDRVKVLDGLFTAQAFITTDLDNNQITAFHPGAMMRSHENHVRDVAGRRLGIVAPDGRDGDAADTRSEFAAAGIPFIFDPGQAMPLFNGAELRRLHRAGRLRHRQRLRIQPAAGTYRLGREDHRRPGQGLHHYPGPARAH